MRFAAIEIDNRPALGYAADDKIIDLSLLDSKFPSNLKDLLEQGEEAMKLVETKALRAPASLAIDPDQVKFRPLIENAGKYLCLGLNYLDHAKEGKFEKPTYPLFFMRAATSLLAHQQPIILPQNSSKLDYEGELAVIIGKTARHVTRTKALEHVAGYSCFNDGSIRDYQVKTSQWTIGKNFDSTGPFGPFFVTVDELPPGAKGLRIQTRLNNSIMQDANTRDMIFSVAETISILSEVCTLEIGDVIVMGTPAGVGFARRPPVWLQPGDVVEVEIEGIGTLRNTVVAERFRAK
ncbi:MAG: fumarylacetoacetate hydrolase family protein [Calditrichia bacterium]